MTYEAEGGVAVVRIDDGKANAISPDVADALDEAVARAESDARALMLVGRPGRFSAGFDLSHMKSGDEPAQSLVAAGARLAMRIYGLGIPTVAACSGHAVAMGALLLLSCDTRLAATGEFRIGLNEVAIGLGLPVFAVELARDRLDPRRFAEATMQAQLYDPDAAAEVGFVDRVVMADVLEADALAVAARLAELRTGAYLHTKVRARQRTIDRVLDTLDDDVTTVSFGTAT